jgi:hypothetical protein
MENIHLSPREKAVELVHKFGMENQYYERAKQCALIAVDEILSINSVDKDEDLSNYWEEVKQEIEKL